MYTVEMSLLYTVNSMHIQLFYNAMHGQRDACSACIIYTRIRVCSAAWQTSLMIDAQQTLVSTCSDQHLVFADAGSKHAYM